MSDDVAMFNDGFDWDAMVIFPEDSNADEPKTTVVQADHAARPDATFPTDNETDIPSTITATTVTTQEPSAGGLWNDIATQWNAVSSNFTPSNFLANNTQQAFSMAGPFLNNLMGQRQAPPAPQLHVFASKVESIIEPVGRSRVETQIFVKMILSPMPAGVTKLHLPSHTISKPKLLSNPSPARSPDTLELFVNLVCTSAMEIPGAKQRALERAATRPQGYLADPNDESERPQNGGDVRICSGCIQRERKRAGRRKNKKPDEDKVWMQGEEQRVIVFNTNEMKDWQTYTPLVDKSGTTINFNSAMQVGAPMRIACYCRHHHEKMGFNIIFTIKDWEDRVIAQAMSDPIMITDDHKTNNPTPTTVPTSTSVPLPAPMPVASEPSTAVASPESSLDNFQISQPPIDMQAMAAANQPLGLSIMPSVMTTPSATHSALPSRVISRVASPLLGEPTAKKRKASGCSESSNLALTRLDTTVQGGLPMAANQLQAVSTTFSPTHVAEQQLQQPHHNQFVAANHHQGFSGMATPHANDQMAPFFSHGRNASMDSMAMTQVYSAPASNMPSRAASPGCMPGSMVSTPQCHLSPSSSDSAHSASSNGRGPFIAKIIPAEGPSVGGIEVTVLGQNFLQGLEVWFGNQKATLTTYWGDTSLVCLLPPIKETGSIVPVSFRHPLECGSNFTMSMQPAIFKYIDDSKDKLLKLALNILNNNMRTGALDMLALKDLLSTA
jgi:hypothetical protein